VTLYSHLLRSPFLLDPPVLISLSGGRTSAYMLWLFIQAHGGRLPAGYRVSFQNTGKEREQTLEFVRDIEVNWEIPVTWLEYVANHNGKHWEHGFKIISFDTASRKGEPFAKLIETQRCVPNRAWRFCTKHLKVLTSAKWMRSVGVTGGYNAIGIRFDEPKRWAGKTIGRWERVTPLIDLGITKQHVLAFWNTMPFNLNLPDGDGNCDLCFLKGRDQLQRTANAEPERIGWWDEQEHLTQIRVGSNELTTFRKGESYRDFLTVESERDDIEATEDCVCTD
jgi:3'-phosphoadenosine 5'-phosphosulfate sulfotransferase (PAPS reductase)/FAD synthetase